MQRSAIATLGGLLLGAAAFAQVPAITVGDLECLQAREHTLPTNAVLTAEVKPEVGGASVRLYFRRLNPVGALYYDELHAAGGGRYWTVFPKPEYREQQQLTDEWWEVLVDRDWMQGHDRQWLEDWLEAQENEAAEYFVAVHDAAGARLAKSPTRLVEVREADDCPLELDQRQAGWAHNLTVGETTEVQAGRQVFHWLCDGIVTRIGADDVLREDDYCRACVVAMLPRLAPVVGVMLPFIDPEPSSPTQPPILSSP